MTIITFNGKTYENVKGLKRNEQNRIYCFTYNGQHEIVAWRDVKDIIDTTAKDEPVLRGLF